ncbi:unnamed protein product [Phyllotreta striolata]|uniref:Cytochrome P450 n=1 Tax=Phyllotreta striolata TaxID=444603 RepID=A0A9N9TAN4_PHYSR|nr:unnamed protein product [Phyllotreta striolata]
MTVITGDSLFDSFLALVTFTLTFVVYYKRAFRYWKNRGVPFPKPTIPWGSLQSYFTPKMSMGDEFAAIYRETREKGLKHVGLFTMTSPLYVPVDVELVKQVLIKDFHYFTDKGIYVNEKDEPIGAHLFAIGGQKWRNLRSKFTPSFTSAKMKKMYKTVINVGNAMEMHLNKKNLQDPVDIRQILCDFTISTIATCAFGLKCGDFDRPNPFAGMAKRMVNRTIIDDVKFAIAVNYPNFAKAIRLTWIPALIKDFFTRIVEKTVRYREENGIVVPDFLQSMIDLKGDRGREVLGDGNSVTMEEIVAQSFVFFVAGYETSATTMSWTLFELAHNPECQDRVREEFTNILDKYNGEMTYEALNELVYLRQCIDETLRKYPPVPYLTRECVRDYKVPETEVVIEEGVKIVIPVRGLHYDEEYFSDAEKYDPDRFSERNKEKIKLCTYLPFGEGPRLCIGKRFGIMQTKIGIFYILKNYRISVSRKMKMPVKLTTAFIPQAEGGLWLDFEKIK